MRLKAISDTSSFCLIVDPKRGCARTRPTSQRLNLFSLVAGHFRFQAFQCFGFQRFTKQMLNSLLANAFGV
jgi:hypothetical protein